ncbi:alpha/beta hydrolase [Solwaraspora sp. WMMD1047]|uniref:alpha/beta fold hydrolase n=1 Tax=Solwaraspora sp. WMMD1047 TaxID=3016102 RepID=UPI0024160212|nr:alpha/beta hydrolase [Solwaraspora sp. WMMD1047]MDG4828365.1 alpha/beta hydrolase [Solwaraspora sp. WMMD1047]
MKRAMLGPEELLTGGAVPPPWPGRPVTLDGTVTYVRETPATGPNAEPALFVHGLGGSSQNWTDLAGLLSGRLAAHAIDLPGFGRSDPGVSYTIRAFADRVVRYLEHSDRGPVHLIGNSLGGAISIRIAALRPDLVRTLTLISPAMPFLDPRRSLQGRMLPLLAIPRAELLAGRLLTRLAPEEMASQVLEACVADITRICDQRRQEAIEEIRLRYTLDHYATAYLRTLRGLVGSFLRAYLPGSNSLWRIARLVTAPSLVIGGRRDRLVDPRVSPQVAKVLSDSRLLMLPDVGHVAQLEVPRTVARATLALLDEVAGAEYSGSAMEQRNPAVGRT